MAKKKQKVVAPVVITVLPAVEDDTVCEKDFFVVAS